jgi:hypothetical protein
VNVKRVFLDICVVHAAVFIQLNLGHIYSWAYMQLCQFQFKGRKLGYIFCLERCRTGANISRPTNYMSVRLEQQ